MEISNEIVPCVILAGGKGRRMGGKEKALIPLLDRPLLSYVLEKVSGKVAPIALNINTNLEQFTKFGYPIIEDPIKGHLGPLAGILASLNWAQKNNNDWVMTLPCDTPFLPNNIVQSMLKAKNNQPNIDLVVAKTRYANPIFRKSFLEKMWQKFVSNDDIIVANYLAERYLIPLANQQNDTSLALKLTQFKNLSIGNSAPDFILDESSLRRLSTLDVAENYILVFWSSGCSHCLKELPQLHSLSQKLNSTKYKVVAVGLEENYTKWSSEIKKFPNFINAIKLQKWNNKVVKDYALTSTPTYFVLDQDKKFKFKPEGLKDLKTYLNKE